VRNTKRDAFFCDFQGQSDRKPASENPNAGPKNSNAALIFQNAAEQKTNFSL